MNIVVANPDAPLAVPAYEGPSREAWKVLAPGSYTATLVSDDESDGTEVGLLVSETGSLAAPIVDIDKVHGTSEPSEEADRCICPMPLTGHYNRKCVYHGGLVTPAPLFL